MEKSNIKNKQILFWISLTLILIITSYITKDIALNDLNTVIRTESISTASEIIKINNFIITKEVTVPILLISFLTIIWTIFQKHLKENNQDLYGRIHYYNLTVYGVAIVSILFLFIK